MSTPEPKAAPLPQSQLYPPRSTLHPMSPDFLFHALVHKTVHEIADLALGEVQRRTDLSDFRNHPAAHWLGRIVYLLRAYVTAALEPNATLALASYMKALAAPTPHKETPQ